MKILTYLACPYSHSDPAIRKERFEAVTLVAAKLVLRGHYVYSPITHGHPITEAKGLRTDWDYWTKHDRPILEISRGMIVLQLPGWEQSVGVQAEIRIAQELNIPVKFLRVEDLP